MSGDRAPVDAEPRRQRQHAFAVLMAVDEIVDLRGCQEGLSRPNLSYDSALRWVRGWFDTPLG